MPRRRSWQMRRRLELDPDVREALELGSSVLAWTSEQLAGAWKEYGDVILEAWIRKYPGHRPAGWWAFDAPEPRLVLEGRELLMPKLAPTDWEWVWRTAAGGAYGVEAFVQKRPADYEGPGPLIESALAHLQRLGLLTAVEDRRCYTADLEPQRIDPFVLDRADPEDAGVMRWDSAAWREHELRRHREREAAWRALVKSQSRGA